MKKLAIRLSLLVIIMVCLDLATGYVMDNIYARTQKGDYGRNNYISSEMQQECLIFGSSRAIHHYDPLILEKQTGMKWYNCGEDGMGIVAMYARYQMVRTRYIPKIIVYDIISFFDIEKGDNTKYTSFLRFYTSNDSIRNLLYEIDPCEKYKMLSKSYKYNTCFIDLTTQYLSKGDFKSADFTYSPLKGVIDYDISETDTFGAQIDSLKIGLLKKFMKTCEEDGTLLIFVISPYYNAPDHECNNALIKFFADNNAVYLNHFSDSDFVHEKVLFKDRWHLNENGAQKYSSKIGGEINNVFQKKVHFFSE